MTETLTVSISRRERVKAFKQQEILLAAQQIFANKGYEQATIEEIADAADYSKGALYKYFENKEAIFLSLIDKGFEDFERIIHRAFDGEAPIRSQFQAFSHDALTYFEENRDYLSILVRENLKVRIRTEGEFRERFSERRKQLVDIIASGLQRGIDEGSVKPINTYCLVEVFWNMVFVAALHFHNAQFSDDIGETAETIVTLFFDGASMQ